MTGDQRPETSDLKPPVTGHRSPVTASRPPVTGHRSPVTAFTVSELECYERCPQEYRLKHVLRLPASQLFPAVGQPGTGRAPRLAANLRGSIVHGVLESLDPNRPEEIPVLIDRECIANGILPDARTRRDIQEAIDAALSLPIAPALAEGSRELRFDWRVGDAVVTGSIDWLCPFPSGPEVIDFKTDEVTPSEVPRRAEAYDLQLVCYALAAEAATGTPTSATALAFLTPGVVHRVPMDERRRAAGRKRVGEIVGAIEEGRFAIGREPPCITCPYHHNGICWEDRVNKNRTLVR